MHGLVLVIADRPGTLPACLEAAHRVAGLFDDARVETLHIRPSPETEIVPIEGMLTAERATEFSQAIEERAAAVHRAYDRWLRPLDDERKSRFTWTETVGATEREVRDRGSTADLIVLGQPGGIRDLGGRQILRTAILETDRPVLMMPRDSPTTLGRSVAILWDEQRPTTKAVLTAMPILARAKRLFLLAFGSGRRATSRELPRLLIDRDLRAEMHPIDYPHYGSAGTILTYAHQLGADLLVSGAYAQHPLVEWLIRGRTRYLTFRSDLPMLMRH
jgi:hypothetical protein